MWSSSRERDRIPRDESNPHPRYASCEDVTIGFAGPSREIGRPGRFPDVPCVVQTVRDTYDVAL